MERLLITAGEQYLPFARSRIKAMRATGLQYASQKFEVDGCSIRVRIEPGQEYIQIEGGSVLLVMDSGIVGIASTGGPNRNVPGILYEPANVAEYNSAFLPYAKSARWRKHGGGAGQLSGHVTYSSGSRPGGGNFSGLVPHDRRDAECLSGGYATDNFLVPPSLVLDKEDDRVCAKKRVMEACHASVFTGKCRLYVQAMYGRPLTVPSNSETPTPVTHIDFPLEKGGIAGCPNLTIAAYRHDKKDAEEDVSRVEITTSSGIWLNPITGEHWILTVWANEVACRPLIPESRLAKLRKYLTASDTTLDSTDKEHLEAYILSTSLPSHAGFRTFGINTLIGPNVGGAATYATAYGWHWNWSGTAADIVATREVLQSTDAIGDILHMKSSHLSLNIVYDRLGPIGTKMEILQNDVDWSLSRRFHVVTAPDWVQGGQRKVNPYRFTEPFAFADVAFYAYYNRDSLVICSASCSIGSHGARAIGPSAGEPLSDDFSNGHPLVTSGGGSASVEDQGACDYIEVTFKIGGVSSSPLPTGNSRSFYRQEVNNKSQGAWSPGPSFMTQGTPTVNFNGSDYPAALGRYYYTAYTFNFSTWDYIRTYGNKTSYGVGIVIIPVMDSEAAFLKQSLYHEEEKTISTQHLTSANMQTSYWYRSYLKTVQFTPVWGEIVGPNGTAVPAVIAWDGPTTEITYVESVTGSWGQGGGAQGVPSLSGSNRIVDTEQVIPYELIVDSDTARLIHKSGITEVTIDLEKVGSLITPDTDRTATPFGVLTGISQASGAVVCQDAILPDGIHGAPIGINTPAFVGWA